MYNFFSLDASGNPVTETVISVTDSSGNLVTGEFQSLNFFNSLFNINGISKFNFI